MKKILTPLLAFLTLNAFAQTEEENTITYDDATGFYYLVNEDGESVTLTNEKNQNWDDSEYKKIDSAIVIPSEIAGLPVTAIGRSAFNGSSLTSVTIPASVKTLDYYTFRSCTYMTEVKFEENSQLETINYHAFIWDAALTSFTVPASVTFIDESGLACCELETLIFEKGSKLKELGDFALQGNHFKSVELPEGLEIIGTGCFIYCDGYLKEVTIPSTVTEIKRQAFLSEDDALEKIICNAILPPTLDTCVFYGYDDELLNSEDGTYSDSEYYTGIIKNITYKVPDGAYYLYLNDESWSEYFNDETNSILEGDALKDNFGNSYYFYYVDEETQELALELYTAVANDGKVEIPTSVDGYKVLKINESAFKDLDFTELTLNWAYEDIPENIDSKELFEESTTKLILHVPSGSEESYHDSDWFNYFIIYGYNGIGDTFTIDGITYEKTADEEANIIGVRENEIEFVTSVTFNTEVFTVLSIEDGAFEGCSGLKASVNFIDPETIELGEIATNKVGYLTVPDGAVGLYEKSDWAYYFEVDTINRYLLIDSVYYVFKTNSTKTTSLKASHSSISVEVDHVDENATNVTIHGSINLGDDMSVSYEVTSMNANAFKDCGNLTSITIEANIPAEDAEALNQVPEGCTIVVSDDLYDAYSTVFANTNITVKAASDAISTIKVDEKVEIARYNLLGQKIANPQKGINIIKYSDGTVEKVLVK